MRDHYDEFKARGAEIVAIGMGWPAAAAAFREEHGIPFPVIVDHTKETYRALGLRRAPLTTILRPDVVARGAVAVVTGHAWRRARQDYHMLGGSVVVARGGDVLLVHRSNDPADNLPVQKLLDALPD